MWFKNASETVVAEWVDPNTSVAYDTEITSAVVRFKINDAGVQKFLQADLTTFDTPDHSFALTKVGTEWSYTLTVPATAQGFNLCWEATPTPGDFGMGGQLHYVGPVAQTNFNFDGFLLNGVV